MADLTLTSANVAPSDNAIIITGLAAAAIAAGQTVYEDTATLDSIGRPKFRLYDANASTPTAIVFGVCGIAANTAGINQPLDVAISDPAFVHGLTGVTKGDILIASATTPGSIAPAADLAAGWRPAVVLIATSVTAGVLAIAQNTTAK
jgi:hypothetical protein